MRMDPSGIQEPTGPAFTYLMNGLTARTQNWTALFRPGERVRLRFINTSAQTSYDVSIPGLTMTSSTSTATTCEPVPVDQFRIERRRNVRRHRAAARRPRLHRSSRRTGPAAAMRAARWRRGPACRPRSRRWTRRRCATMADMGMAHDARPRSAPRNPDRTRIDGIMPSHARRHRRPERRAGASASSPSWTCRPRPRR